MPLGKAQVAVDAARYVLADEDNARVRQREDITRRLVRAEDVDKHELLDALGNAGEAGLDDLLVEVERRRSLLASLEDLAGWADLQDEVRAAQLAWSEHKSHIKKVERELHTTARRLESASTTCQRRVRSLQDLERQLDVPGLDKLLAAARDPFLQARRNMDNVEQLLDKARNKARVVGNADKDPELKRLAGVFGHARKVYAAEVKGYKKRVAELAAEHVYGGVDESKTTTPS